ncbi:MAG: DUF2130 domain-containing protein [Thermoanaerobaculia bacterium]
MVRKSREETRTYECPVCATRLTREKYESALGIYEARGEELARREDELKSRENDFQKEKAQLILQAKQAREAGLAEGRAAEKKLAADALASEREGLARQKRELDKREDEFKRQKTELVAKAKASLAEGIEQGIQSEKKRAERLLSGQAETIAKLEQKIKQLEKGSTPQTEGLEFEDTLVERLQMEFPTDEVEHHGKGGDILHYVIDSGRRIGSIVYECKRVAQIQRAHVKQAWDARRQREADFAVLITTGTRKGFSGLDEEDGVVIVAPLGVLPLAALLRQTLIQLARARAGSADRTNAAEQVMRYMTSPQFRNPLEDMMKRSEVLQQQLQDEVKLHVKVWNERWASYQSIGWDASQIDTNVQLVLQGSPPRPIGPLKVEPLRLGEGK